MYETTLHRLRVFKVVVEAGGVGAAATELGVSQPAVSGHIRALESVLGQQLFVRRHGQHPELTDAGRILYAYAHDAVIGADSVNAVLHDISQGLRGRISIAMTRTLGHSVVGPVLAEFHRQVPQTLVTVRSASLAEVTQFVTTGAVSLALVVTSGPLGSLVTEFLRFEPTYLIASPDHPLASRESVAPEELREERHIVSRQSWNFRPTLTYLREAGFSYERISFETDDYVMMKRLVEYNCGIALLPRESVERELENGQLVALRTNFELPTFQLGIAHLVSHRFTPSESRLMELFRKMLGEDADAPPPQPDCDREAPSFLVRNSLDDPGG